MSKEMESNLPTIKDSIPEEGGKLLEEEDDMESVYDVPLPPDGGWGWVVMMASFFTNLLVDGVCYTFATIYQGGC